MLKKLLILLLLTLSVSIYGSKNWRKVSQSSYDALTDVFFLNENLGWIAGSSGTILKTMDGGSTWFTPMDTLPVISTMNCIFFANENIGYAGGSSNLLLKTLDGGATWNQVDVEATSGNIYSLYFADENTGWIMNGYQVLYTNDGGDSWSVQLTGVTTELRSMDFSSPEHGICVGGKSGVFALYYTSDGLTWNQAPTPTNLPSVYTRTDLYAVAMANDSVACATGWGSSAAGLQPSFTFRTKDGGANWNYENQAEKNRQYVNLQGMTFLNEMTGIAVGGSTYKGTVAYKTTDGGLTWRETYLPFGFQGKSISMINDKICVVGSIGGIALSNDAGQTWELITPVVNSTLYDIEQLPNQNILAAGFYGGLMISTDAGENWESRFIAGNNVCPTVENIFFLDNNIGYAAHRNRMVSKTIDGGLTWTQIMKDTMATSVNNLDVQFINENIGFVVGKLASDISAFYKTVDGGNTWTTQIATLPNELNSLHFFDESNGVVVGNESVLAYTGNGGDNWAIANINGISGQFDFNEVEFFNSNLGLAAGEILVKSTDAGKTWNYIAIEGLPSKIEAVEIVNESTWYVTGSKYLFQTTNSGETWTNIIDLEVVTASTNYDLFVDSLGYPWLACGSSEIFTVSPEVSVKKTDDNFLNNFALKNNYPNPFNPSTKIQYSIPKSTEQNVLLKVYDMLGQEVATLVNETQKAGTYEVEFNASKLSSGIYIYTLKNAGLSASRKMLLIK
ncbi:MAG: T9SS type A sorting domain-containing protein [Bacteroidetes bacterium]|nr:T9SS type A sorting domain-containing protein [Bacteroidota bacterium]MBU1114714.1 T9SS type A sorting domain-containing protein [Bacteroidota bacterium]MBU1798916.1 T9SS type A sorting domain-containing protein [Bacteroidota bacterium]